LEIVCVSEVVCEEAFTTPQARVTTAAALRRIILMIGLLPISEAKYPIWFDFGSSLVHDMRRIALLPAHIQWIEVHRHIVQTLAGLPRLVQAATREQTGRKRGLLHRGTLTMSLEQGFTSKAVPRG